MIDRIVDVLMARNFSVLFLGAVLSATMAAPVYSQSSKTLFDRLPDEVRASKTIKVVGNTYPPYRMLESDGKTVTGVDADLLKLLEPVLGVKFEQIIVGGLPAMLTGVESGRFDFTPGPLIPTAERAERFDFITWLVTKPAFVIPVASGRKTTKIEDLCGLRLAVQEGSIAESFITQLSERCVAEKLAEPQPVRLDSYGTTILATESGRADAALTQLTLALYLQKQSPGKFTMQTDQTDKMGVQHLAMAIKKGSPLTPVLLDALKQVWSSGQYAKLMESWNFALAKIDMPELNPKIGDGKK